VYAGSPSTLQKSELIVNELVVSEQSRQLFPGSYLRILEDPSVLLQLSDLQAPDSKFNWQLSASDIPNFGYSKSAFWFALDLKNDAATGLQRILEIGYPLLDKVELYQGNIQHGQFIATDEPIIVGDNQPFSQRVISHRNFLIPLEIPPSSSLRLSFRVESGSSVQFPLTLWDNNALFESEQFTLIYLGICFGGLLMILIYNLFLYFSLDDRSYLYFVFTLFFIVLMQASLRGLSYQFLWPDFPAVQGRVIPVLICWGVASLAAFSSVFLNLKRNEFVLRRLISGAKFILLLSGLAVMVVDSKTGTQLTVILVSGYLVLGLFAGVRSWLKGFTPAIMFILAYVLGLTATVVFSLNTFGFLPANLLVEKGQEFWLLLEAMILAVALANRLSVMRRKKALAEGQTRTRLERKVIEQTQQVNDALNQLELANYKLSRQSREDSLTQLFNRRAFDEMLEAEWSRAQRSRNPLALVLGDIDHFKSVNDKYGHLNGDDCLRQISLRLQSKINRPGDKLFRFGEEEFALLLPETDLEGALLVAERMRKAVAEPKFKLQECEQEITMSFGVAAAVPTANLSFQDLIFGADQALYRAKEYGRNRVELTNSVVEHSF
jgi:two-component system, sensor histidine kinase LadS